MPYFWKTNIAILNLIYLDRYEVLILVKAKRWTIAKMVDEKWTFRNFLYFRYATNVTFQQAISPSGNVAEGKIISVANTSSTDLK